MNVTTLFSYRAVTADPLPGKNIFVVVFKRPNNTCFSISKVTGNIVFATVMTGSIYIDLSGLDISSFEWGNSDGTAYVDLSRSARGERIIGGLFNGCAASRCDYPAAL